MGWEIVDWIHVVQDKKNWPVLVNRLINFRVPKKAGIFLIFFTTSVTTTFSRILFHGVS
jgi:hypothetical protein